MVHTPTLLLSNLLLFATLAAVLALVARRDGSDGLRDWSAGLAVHVLAYALYALRGQVSDVWSIVVANVALSATFAFLLRGLAHFQRARLPVWWVWTPVVLMLLVFALWMNDITQRVLWGTALLLVQTAQLQAQLLRHWAMVPGRGRILISAGLLLFALMMTTRAAGVMLGRFEIVSLTDSNAIQGATFLLGAVTMLLAALGMVVMTREEADARNRELALRDELSGLHNRRSIQQVLQQQLAVARRQQRPLSVLIIDIDHFKQVNDTHGHLSGDRVLHDLAQRLRTRLRAQDAAARWGGEEFLVVLPDTTGEGAVALAEELRQAVQQKPFTVQDGQPVALTISAGVHALPEGPQAETDDMVLLADRALYRAKERGRNRVERL
jgi:diguanylate cyclase (GGDEF)-like protein